MPDFERLGDSLGQYMNNGAFEAKPSVGTDCGLCAFINDGIRAALSPRSAQAITWNGLLFMTPEAAFHSEKFPHLPHIQEAIRTACSVFEAARISIENDHVVRHSWNLMQDRIMESVLRQMVAQHRVVATTLLDTGNDLIIFDRADDGYWGTGANGLGQNKLGRLWMKVRADLLAAGIDRFSPMPKVSKAALGLPLD